MMRSEDACDEKGLCEGDRGGVKEIDGGRYFGCLANKLLVYIFIGYFVGWMVMDDPWTM